MKLYVLIQEVHIFGRLISARVLGSNSDYDREVSVHYPGMVDEEPSAANGWVSTPIPTFDAQDLKEALSVFGYSPNSDETFAMLGRFLVKPEKGVTLSGDANHMPSIGHVKVTTRTVEIEV
jgi:hypothetical protein